MTVKLVVIYPRPKDVEAFEAVFLVAEEETVVF